MVTPDSLPVAADLAQIVRSARTGAVVVTAPPGSGKTTLVPPALLDDLPSSQHLILVQPRRLAARAIARRIAHLRGSSLGGEVGYQVRFDQRITAATRLHVVTPGILLRRLIGDLSIDRVGAVVLDEFHERTLEMDLALGLLVRLRETIREDLRVVVMSATLDTVRVQARLGGCPLVHSPGTVYPVDVHYDARRELGPLPARVAAAVPPALQTTAGHVLIFLPGVGEILRTQAELRSLAERESIELLPLYGDLPPDQQDRVLAPGRRRKIILATNVAETSLTIDGVTAVIDSGLARQNIVHPSVGLPRLELIGISRAAADQRAGRAGRTTAGHCWRLWERAAHSARPAYETPEVLRSDLAQTLLQLFACGERQVPDFPWLEPPPDDAVETARSLLLGLHAIDERNQLTDVGRQLLDLPTHPRLGRLILQGAASGIVWETALAAAILSERDPFRLGRQAAAGPRDRHTLRSRSDLADRVFALQAFANRRPLTAPYDTCEPHAAQQVLRAATQLAQLAPTSSVNPPDDVESSLMQALLIAFGDRLARLRPGTRDRGVMVGGRGVRLDDDSRVRDELLFLCLELNDAAGNARVRMASAAERSWLDDSQLRTVDELFFNPSRGQVEARRRTYFHDLLLEETPTAVRDLAQAAELLGQHAQHDLSRVLPSDDQLAAQFRNRVRWLTTALPESDLARLDDAEIIAQLPEICHGLRSIEELRQARWLEHFHRMVGYDRLADVERLAPAELQVPSGNRIRLDYGRGKTPILAVRIQELFGLAHTPKIGGGRVPVLLHLLGPNYRPQQVTDDLASFWQNTYPQVKKELRRRYPKHAWPDDPLSATATRSGLNRQRTTDV